MDGTRFDTLTAALSANRRTALRAGGIAALGALLLRIGLDDAAAACKGPGQKCGNGDKCCGDAKCKNDRCRCPKGRTGCGKTCCQPGQICLDGAPDTCVNGPKQPGDSCDPNKPLACESGTCSCISNGEGVTACTCRQETCLGAKSPCTNTSQCCVGGCSGFTEKCEADL